MAGEAESRELSEGPPGAALFTGVVPGMVLYVLMVIIIPPEPKPPRAD